MFTRPVRRLNLTNAALSIALAACTRSQLGQVIDVGAAQEIRAALASWVTATRAGDRNRANAIWAPDLVGWYPGQPDDTYEREQGAARRPASSTGARTVPAVDVVEVIVSGDLAVVRDIWRMTRIVGGDSTMQVIKGFEVWRRQPDGRWRISRWLSAPEPAGAAR